MATALTEAPLAGVLPGGGRRRVVLLGVVEPKAAASVAGHGEGEAHGCCGGCGGCADSTADKKDDKVAAVAAAEADDNGVDDVAPAHYAAELQARRLYTALGQTTDNERDAYRRNKTEQTRLEMALDHIGIQRSVASKNLQGDMRVMKVRSSRIGDRAMLTREGASPACRAVSTSYPRYPYGGHADNPDVLPTIGASSSGRLPAMMTAPGAGGRRSGAHSITFVSEVHPRPAVDHAAEPATSGPQRSVLGPMTANRGIRSNATRYVDTSTPIPYGGRTQELSGSAQVWSSARAARGGGAAQHAEQLHQRTQEAYQPADMGGRARPSMVQLHKQQKAASAKAGIKQRPLVAIVSSSLIAASRLTNSTKHRAAATRSLDADIDAVLNSRLEGAGGGGAGGCRGFQGVGLRQPANFSSNYRPSVELDDEEQLGVDGELLGLVDEGVEEEAFLDDRAGRVEALRSLTSFSTRLPIDRVATPSSNTFRGEMGRRGHATAFSAKSAPQASIPLQRELLASSGRREAHREGMPGRPFRLEQALRREVTQMKGFEDRLALFYDKLKGPHTAAGKRGGSKSNHWDLRGLDEKLMLY